jgi:hypothetical protein
LGNGKSANGRFVEVEEVGQGFSPDNHYASNNFSLSGGAQSALPDRRKDVSSRAHNREKG